MKKLSILVFACYFVSMVIGPAYANFKLKGTDNGITYDIYMHQWGKYGSDVMQKDSLYDIEVLAYNGDLQVSALSIVLPSNFVLNKSYTQVALLTGKQGRHIFSITTPKEIGDYRFLFKGSDVENHLIEFSVPIKVADKESPGIYEGGAGGIIIILGAVAGLLFMTGWAIFK